MAVAQLLENVAVWFATQWLHEVCSSALGCNPCIWVTLAAFLLSFGSTPIHHGPLGENGVEDLLPLELLPNLLSKAIIPFANKMALLHAFGIYRNNQVWKDVDAMAEEMFAKRKSRWTEKYPRHNKRCLIER